MYPHIPPRRRATLDAGRGPEQTLFADGKLQLERLLKRHIDAFSR